MTTLSFPYTLAAADPQDVTKLNSNLNAIATVVNGQITNGNLSGSAAITDANLASPNNSAYKTVASGPLALAGGVGTNTYFLDRDGGLHTTDAYTSGIPLLQLATTDYAVAGKTTYLRMSYSLAVNATAHGSTVKVGLYPVSGSAGGSGALTVTLSAVVSGSQATVTNTGGGTIAGNSGDFAHPATGSYVPGVAITVSSTAAAFAAMGTWMLQVRNA